MKELYRKNEWETNELVSGAIRILAAFLLAAAFFCWTGIFDIPAGLFNQFLLSVLIWLVLPSVIVDVLRLRGSWVKYVLITCAAAVVTTAYIFFTFQTVLLFMLPAIMAAMYLGGRVLLTAAAETVIGILISHAVTGFHLFQPWVEPFTGMKEILLYGAFPRILQYLCGALLLAVCNRRNTGYIRSLFSILQDGRGQINPQKEQGQASDCGAEKKALEEITVLLTERELDVFRLLVLGYTNAQIAGQLCLSIGTVKNYVSSVYDKTGIRERTVLVLKYSAYYQECDGSNTVL